MFDGTYTNVSASSVRSHRLYQNANVFGLKRLFLSAPKVQQLDVRYRDGLDLKITGARSAAVQPRSSQQLRKNIADPGERLALRDDERPPAQRFLRGRAPPRRHARPHRA